MPVDEVAWVLEKAHRFCDDHGLGFGAYPMHELAAHPQAVELLRLFADHVGGGGVRAAGHHGVPLAVREDWRDLLTAAAKLGTTTVSVAFHGVGTEHDRQLNRTGAWEETCLAVQRVHSGGAAGRLQRVPDHGQRPAGRAAAEVVRRLEVDQAYWGPATYHPTAGAAATSGCARRCRSC
jgi:sugar phosphate isomerase/epimerase